MIFKDTQKRVEEEELEEEEEGLEEVENFLKFLRIVEKTNRFRLTNLA